MRRQSTRRGLWPVLSLAVLAGAVPGWRGLSQVPAEPTEGAPEAAARLVVVAAPRLELLAFAETLLDRPADRDGDLEVQAALLSGSEVESVGGWIAVALDAAVVIDPAWRAGQPLRVTLVAYNLDAEPRVLEESVALAEPGNAAWWSYRRIVELSDEFLEAVVVIEDLGSGRRGGARVGYGSPFVPPPTPRSGVLVDAEAAMPSAAAGPSGAGPPRRASVLRLVPPLGRDLTGQVRVRTLTSTGDVARVVFFLDGVEAARDDREPFVAEIDLGSELRPREVVAVAYSAAGRELGRDRLLLNGRLDLFDVALRLERSGDRLDLQAAIRAPQGNPLERVEIYRNEELLATQTEEPFGLAVRQDELGRDDYLRVVAYLADGTSLDDVRLATDAGAGTRIEVNLVQVFAVASDRRGEPLTDLTEADFEVKVGRRPVEIERFELATDVPLSLGLVFDTSGSMYALMPDALQAGGRFLDSIVRSQDRAFLVDFDTRPRLAHGLTADVGSLLRRFGGLKAEGNTALYDALVFALLQFDTLPGRRAMVVLTDGVPSGGKFSARQCIERAIELAVPIYSIDLSGVFGGPGTAKLPLVGLAKATGGRVHAIQGDPSLRGGDYEAVGRSLTQAYDQIERELRSQYVLAFSTDQPLTGEEIESVQVDVKRPGVKVRRVVGAVRE